MNSAPAPNVALQVAGQFEWLAAGDGLRRGADERGPGRPAQVDGGARDPGPARDLRERHAGHADLGDELQDGVEDGRVRRSPPRAAGVAFEHFGRHGTDNTALRY